MNLKKSSYIYFFLAALLLSTLVMRGQKPQQVEPNTHQKVYCVINAENKTPMRDVVVHTNTEHWAMTDYTGSFMMRYDWDSAEVSKPGFISFEIYAKFMPDTIVMLPKSKHLNEVEVWGKDQRNESLKAMGESIRKQAAATPRASSGIITGDFLGWMDTRGRRDARHRKHAKQVLDSLSEKPDPIIQAYKDATEKGYTK